MIAGFRVIDLHVHSELSGCADKPPGYTAELVLRHAAALGVDGLAFTDHVLEPQRRLPARLVAALGGRPGLERVRSLRARLAAMDTAGLPSFAIGAEVDVFAPGLFAITPAHSSELDLAVMAANHAPLDCMPAPAADDPAAIARHLLDNAVAAVQSGFATSLAHPFVPFGWARGAAAFALLPEADVAGLFEEMRDRHVLLGFSRHLIGSQHLVPHKHAARLYSLAATIGVGLAFETDCHQLWHMSCIVPLVELAIKFGLAPAHFISELP